jgi:hypothetical protein
MEMIFEKRDGKFDLLTIVRETGDPETVSCPKQGTIPHDMIHYAVESILTHRGFLSLVKEGQAADFTTQGGDSEEPIERLVETFQAEMWGNLIPTTDLIAIYENACTARGHSIATISPENVQAIRTLLEQLSRQWSALPPNEALRLRF